jgi:hypothetical protein
MTALEYEGPGGALVAAEPVALAPGAYTETRITLTGIWTLVSPANLGINKLILSDPGAAGGMFWSLDATLAGLSTVAGTLIPQGGAWVFDPPVPTNAVYVKGPNGSTLTVQVA